MHCCGAMTSGQSRARAAIAAIASYLPARELTNEALASEVGDWPADQIFEKTGIRSRRIAAEGECASDLGGAAARRLFESGGCAPGGGGLLLFCAPSPD